MLELSTDVLHADQPLLTLEDNDWEESHPFVIPEKLDDVIHECGQDV